MKTPGPNCANALRHSWRTVLLIGCSIVFVASVSPLLAANAYLVKDITPGIGGSTISLLTKVDNSLYFRSGDDLWKSDGTLTGTFAVALGVKPLVITEDLTWAYFISGTDRHLWKSDGTPNGTTLVSTKLSTSFALPLTSFNGKIMFGTESSALGGKNVLFQSDGTEAGTQPVQNLSSSEIALYPTQLVVFDSRLFFAAVTAPDSSGCLDLICPSISYAQLWSTNGSSMGAQRLTLLQNQSVQTIRATSRAVFFVSTGNTAFAFGANQLWVTNGTAGGETLLFSIPGYQYLADTTVVGDTLFFVADDGTGGGRQLWKSDGTPQGTLKVSSAARLYYNTNTPSQSTAFFCGVGSTLYFTALHQSSPFLQTSLWQTDGSPGGTIELRQISNSTSNPPRNLTAAGPFLFFTAYDDALGQELWRCSGTPDSTSIVSDIKVGLGSSNPALLTTAGAKLFFTADDGTTGSELWAYDVPAAGPSDVVATVRALPITLFANVSASAGVDMPLEPTPDETLLDSSQASLVGGLVADGVTPLLIKISALTFPTQSTVYSITATISGGHIGSVDTSNGGLTPYLKILQFPVSGAPTFISGTTVKISPGHTNGFAYISGINAENIALDPGSKELLVSLTVAATGATDPHSTVQFRIRRPPVILVHGFNSDAQTWEGAGGDFRGALENTYPADFVTAINYGVNPSSKDPNFRNRIGSLFSLVHDLDNALPAVGPTGPFKDWAMTRYDLICHSQGGVLARMLCAADANAFAVPAFKSLQNAYRGRFRRIVTIGSPQNGSTIEYYASKVISNLQFDLKGAAIRNTIRDQGLLQSKFDPFGVEIKKLNDPANLIDQDAKFHAVIGKVSNACNALAAFFLDDIVKSAVVIPRGCDGVVDFDSARSTYPDSTIYNVQTNTSHSDPDWIFGVSSGSTETHSGAVAQHVVSILNQSPAAFGSFKLPRLLDDKDRAGIDAVVPGVKLSGAVSVRGANIVRSKMKAGSENSLQINLALLPDPAEPVQGLPAWLAEIYGPNGVTANGLAIQIDPNDSTKATLGVPGGAQGDVVVHCGYKSSRGVLIIAKPAVVSSTSGLITLKAISLEPNSPVVSVGDKFSFEIWGAYDNDTSALLYESPDAPASVISSNAAVIAVGPDNELAAKSAGTATITVSFRGLTTQSVVTSVAGGVIPVFPTVQLANIATRLSVQTSDNVLIAGFIVTGTQPKRVALRGIGSSLPLSGVLGNPVLELYDGTGQLLESNDNWRDSVNIDAITSADLAPSSDLECAIIRTLPANNSLYTVVLRGANNTTGIGVVEAYDLDTTVDSKLANISTRGFVNTGDDVMIGGTIIVGSTSATILVRAVGPSLAAAGVPGALQDPTLELHDGQGNVVAFNDNWRDSQEADIQATTIPPSDDRESAILRSLPPGAYTAIVRGSSSSTGVALVEAYQLR